MFDAYTKHDIWSTFMPCISHFSYIIFECLVCTPMSGCNVKSTDIKYNGICLRKKLFQKEEECKETRSEGKSFSIIASSPKVVLLGKYISFHK